jgi:hypothetical protein
MEDPPPFSRFGQFHSLIETPQFDSNCAHRTVSELHTDSHISSLSSSGFARVTIGNEQEFLREVYIFSEAIDNSIFHENECAKYRSYRLSIREFPRKPLKVTCDMNSQR